MASESWAESQAATIEQQILAGNAKNVQQEVASLLNRVQSYQVRWRLLL